MIKEVSKHLQHYLPLIGIIGVGFIGLYYFSYDITFQIAVAVSIAAAYVVWGVVSHYLNRDLYLAVVIEYVAVAILGLVIIFSLLFST